MNRSQIIQWTLWVATVGSLVAMLGAYRFFSIPPALRGTQHEAIWQTVPYVLLLVVMIVLVLTHGPRGRNGQ